MRLAWNPCAASQALPLPDRRGEKHRIPVATGSEPPVTPGARSGRWTDRAVAYPFGELDEVTLAFATTIHKSQGSEYPAVVIPILTQHYTMLQRNLLYTGITRGKRLVVLVGQKKAVAMAVRNSRSRRRWSKLRELLLPPGEMKRTPI